MPPRRTATPRPQPPSPTQPKKSSSRKQPICTLAPTSHAFTTSPASDLVTVQGFQLLGFVQFLGVAISTLFLQGVLNGLVVYVWGKSPEIARASKGTANGWGLISGLAAWKVVEVGLGLSILGLNAWHSLLLFLLLHFPHLYLLHTFYLVPITPLFLNLLVAVSAPTLAVGLFSLVFPSDPPLVRAPHQTQKQTLYTTLTTTDSSSTLLLTLLSATAQAIPPLFSLATYLPVHLAVHFQDIPTLGPVHDKLPNVIAFALPFVGSGFALVMLLQPALSLQAEDEPGNENETGSGVDDFDPRTATLLETIMHNLQSFRNSLNWVPRQRQTQRLLKVTLALALWTALGTAFLASTVSGVGAGPEKPSSGTGFADPFLGESRWRKTVRVGSDGFQGLKGPLGWGLPWGAGVVLAGLGMGWAGGVF